jgi:hypothetical protein
MNFNDFINTYRIEAIKQAFAAGEHKKSTLLGIALIVALTRKQHLTVPSRKVQVKLLKNI